jgi:hypothetical protein
MKNPCCSPYELWFTSCFVTQLIRTSSCFFQFFKMDTAYGYFAKLFMGTCYAAVLPQCAIVGEGQVQGTGPDFNFDGVYARC